MTHKQTVIFLVLALSLFNNVISAQLTEFSITTKNHHYSRNRTLRQSVRS
jgi:hypothetical protein